MSEPLIPPPTSEDFDRSLEESYEWAWDTVPPEWEMPKGWMPSLEWQQDFRAVIRRCHAAEQKRVDEDERAFVREIAFGESIRARQKAEAALAALRAKISTSMKGRLRYDDQNIPNGVDFDADWSEDGRDMVAVVSLDALVPVEEEPPPCQHLAVSATDRKGDAVTEYDRGYKDGYDKGRAEYAALQAHFRDCGECLDCLKESGLGALVPIQEEPR